MIWLLLVILLIIAIVAISKGNKKKNLEIEKLQREVKTEPVVSNTSSSVADELSKLAELKNKGLLTDMEFDQEKSKILSRNR